MKKLLHIVLYLPYGGLEKIVYDFSVALNGKGYEVHVVALQAGGPMQDKLEQAGIPVDVLGKRPGKIDFKLLVKLVKLIKKYDIDVIHSHSGCIMYAALAGRLAGVKKIIHTEHGKYFPEPKSRILEDRIFSYLITKYVCVSKELEEYVANTTKIPKRKIKTVINGIDTSKFFKYSTEQRRQLRQKNNVELDAVVLGTVCRLIPPKNVFFLISWLNHHYTVYGNLILMVVGDGPQYAMLKKKADVIPEDRIRFLGEREDIPDLMNVFDIFTLVSISEGTSLTILEAMASQLPVVVSNVGGSGNLVDQLKNGYLFEANDTKGFSRDIRELLDNPKSATEKGCRARKDVLEKFSLISMLNSYCLLYDD